MEAKDKAKELFEKMYNKIQPDELGKDKESAKQCALIVIDEITNIDKLAYEKLNYKNYHMLIYQYDNTGFKSYWTEVKQEINKL